MFTQIQYGPILSTCTVFMMKKKINVTCCVYMALACVISYNSVFLNYTYIDKLLI